MMRIFTKLKSLRVFALLGAGLLLASLSNAQLTLIEDFTPGKNASSDFKYLTPFNGKLYFSGTYPNAGKELMVYDPVSDVISLAANINQTTTTAGSSPANLMVYNNALYFSANDGLNGSELWKFDGTNATLAANINTSTATAGSFPSNLCAHGDTLFLVANDGTNGSELYKYHSVSGAELAADIKPGSGGSYPFHLYSYGNKLCLIAKNTNGKELYVYENGAITEHDINPGTGDSQRFSSGKPYFNALNNILYFSAYEPVNGTELWSFDGINVTLQTDINFGANSSKVLKISIIADVLFEAFNSSVNSPLFGFG